jgi:hypothetical protein
MWVKALIVGYGNPTYDVGEEIWPFLGFPAGKLDL